MNKKNAEARLRQVVEKYLDLNVKTPAFQTIKDFNVQERLANMLLLVDASAKLILASGSDFVGDYLQTHKITKEEWERQIDILVRAVYAGKTDREAIEITNLFRTRKNLLPYLTRELDWVVVSILSASYISASIIMRSILELLIGISTTSSGTTGSRIREIRFLSTEEKRLVLKLYRHLCGWTHPYGKWTKEICPVFISKRPMYHPRLYKQSLKELEEIVDLFLTIGIEKFGISKDSILKLVKRYKIDTSGLPLFLKRH
jgi:hypothetical protein